MTDTQFRYLVTEMRKAQRWYFSTRSRQALDIAKQLENKVDQELKSTSETQTALYFKTSKSI